MHFFDQEYRRQDNRVPDIWNQNNIMLKLAIFCRQTENGAIILINL